ncbi:MAG: hypothetical protein ACRDD1_09745, partial [Planctomycetia bacterium]
PPLRPEFRFDALEDRTVPAAPVGNEFQVNTTTVGEQRLFTDFKSVAMDSDGDFVVAWSSADGSGFGVFAQRFDKSGAKQGPEFRVNTFTTNQQRFPGVAMDDAGVFVVTWTSENQDGDGYGIYAKLYEKSGDVRVDEFRVNDHTTGRQRYSTVAMDADGDFVVVYQDYDQTGGAVNDLIAKKYKPDGSLQSGPFRVNTFTSGDNNDFDVAMDKDGDFVVAWLNNAQLVGGGEEIYGRRFNSSGLAQGGEFHSNTFTSNNQRHATVAMDDDGDFVVAWTSYNQDGDGKGVYAQRYNSTGGRQGGEFRINTTTVGNQRSPAASMDDDGDFVVSWHSDDVDGNGNSPTGYGVYARRYDASGVAAADEFRVNTFAPLTQFHSLTAMDSDGDFVVAWTGDDQDGSDFGVFAQRFT